MKELDIELMVEEQQAASELSMGMAGVKCVAHYMARTAESLWDESNAYSDLYRARINAHVMLLLMDRDLQTLQERRAELVQAIERADKLQLAPKA